MHRKTGERPQNSTSAADEATRIIPTADHARVGGSERRGAIIGSADGESARQIAAARIAGDAAGPMPGETVYIPNDANVSDDPRFDPVVGWLVVRKGPGRGRFCPVFYGQNSIGREADQRVCLDFGDHRISRQGHAFVIYDDLAQKFYIRDGGKTNLVRHNSQLVMTPTELHDRDELTIGSTTLLFVALCGPAFDWLVTETDKGSEEAGKAVTDETNQ